MKKYLNLRAIIALGLIFAFLTDTFGPLPIAYSAEVEDFRLPAPGVMVQLSPAFTPAHLQGLVIHADDPLKFDFLVQRGDLPLSDVQKNEEYGKLVKYFLASLTIPDKDQWVNLSPYEKERIINDNYGKTEMGRDLLAQDYILKQITSSLIYPEGRLGRKFWDRVYERAFKEYGTTRIPVNTFNKVWIIPDEAAVYESGNTVYILRNHLKVMLEEDYRSLQNHKAVAKTTGSIGATIIRQIILPELEKEINTGKNFANLRQIYSGMILATWYKHALKGSFLGKIYANQAKVKGIDQNPQNNQIIYQQYLKAFKKGVFNYIKEDVDKYTYERIPRKYFSGGAVDFSSVATGADATRGFSDAAVLDLNKATGIPLSISSKIDPSSISQKNIDRVSVALHADNAMVSKEQGYKSIDDFMLPVGKDLIVVPSVFVQAMRYVSGLKEDVNMYVNQSPVFSGTPQGNIEYNRFIEYFQMHQNGDEQAGEMYHFFLVIGDQERTAQRKKELVDLINSKRDGGFVGLESFSGEVALHAFLMAMDRAVEENQDLTYKRLQFMFKGSILPIIKNSINRISEVQYPNDKVFFLPFVFPALFNSNELADFEGQIVMAQEHSRLFPRHMDILFTTGLDSQGTLFTETMFYYEGMRDAIIKSLRQEGYDEGRINAINESLLQARDRSIKILKEIGFLPSDFNYQREVLDDMAMNSQDDMLTANFEKRKDLLYGLADLGKFIGKFSDFNIPEDKGIQRIAISRFESHEKRIAAASYLIFGEVMDEGHFIRKLQDMRHDEQTQDNIRHARVVFDCILSFAHRGKLKFKFKDLLRVYSEWLYKGSAGNLKDQEISFVRRALLVALDLIPRDNSEIDLHSQLERLKDMTNVSAIFSLYFAHRYIGADSKKVRDIFKEYKRYDNEIAAKQNNGGYDFNYGEYADQNKRTALLSSLIFGQKLTQEEMIDRFEADTPDKFQIDYNVLNLNTVLNSLYVIAEKSVEGAAFSRILETYQEYLSEQRRYSEDHLEDFLTHERMEVPVPIVRLSIPHLEEAFVRRALDVVEGKFDNDAAMISAETGYKGLDDFVVPAGNNLYFAPSLFNRAIAYVLRSNEINKDKIFSDTEQGNIAYNQFIEYIQSHQEDNESSRKLYKFFLTGNKDLTLERKNQLCRFLDGMKAFVLISPEELLESPNDQIKLMVLNSYAFVMSHASGEEEYLYQALFRSAFIEDMPEAEKITIEAINRIYQGKYSVNRAFFLPFLFPSLLERSEYDRFKRQISIIKRRQDFYTMGDFHSGITEEQLKPKLIPLKDKSVIPLAMVLLFKKGWEGQEPLYVRIMREYERSREAVIKYLMAQGYHADKIRLLNARLIAGRNESIFRLEQMGLLPSDFNYKKKVLNGFGVNVPIVGSPTDGAMLSSVDVEKNSKYTVLIVEDNHPLASAIGNALNLGGGFQVELAHNGQEGLQKVIENPGKYLAVFTDYNMPVKNGLELAEDLDISYPALKVVMHSGEDIPFFKQKRPGNVVAVLNKPQSVMDSLEILNEIRKQAQQDPAMMEDDLKDNMFALYKIIAMLSHGDNSGAGPRVTIIRNLLYTPVVQDYFNSILKVLNQRSSDDFKRKQLRRLHLPKSESTIYLYNSMINEILLEAGKSSSLLTIEDLIPAPGAKKVQYLVFLISKLFEYSEYTEESAIRSIPGLLKSKDKSEVLDGLREFHKQEGKIKDPQEIHQIFQQLILDNYPELFTDISGYAETCVLDVFNLGLFQEGAADDKLLVDESIAQRLIETNQPILEFMGHALLGDLMDHPQLMVSVNKILAEKFIQQEEFLHGQGPEVRNFLIVYDILEVFSTIQKRVIEENLGAKERGIKPSYFSDRRWQMVKALTSSQEDALWKEHDRLEFEPIEREYDGLEKAFGEFSLKGKPMTGTARQRIQYIVEASFNVLEGSYQDFSKIEAELGYANQENIEGDLSLKETGVKLRNHLVQKLLEDNSLDQLQQIITVAENVTRGESGNITRLAELTRQWNVEVNDFQLKNINIFLQGICRIVPMPGGHLRFLGNYQQPVDDPLGASRYQLAKDLVKYINQDIIDPLIDLIKLRRSFYEFLAKKKKADYRNTFAADIINKSHFVLDGVSKLATFDGINVPKPKYELRKYEVTPSVFRMHKKPFLSDRAMMAKEQADTISEMLWKRRIEASANPDQVWADIAGGLGFEDIQLLKDEYNAYISRLKEMLLSEFLAVYGVELQDYLELDAQKRSQFSPRIAGGQNWGWIWLKDIAKKNPPMKVADLLAFKSGVMYSRFNFTREPIEGFFKHKGLYFNYLNKKKASAANQNGGIDFNPAHLNLQINRDGQGIVLPLAQQDMAQLNKIQGFMPVILEIKPAVNLPIIRELQQELQSSVS